MSYKDNAPLIKYQQIFYIVIQSTKWTKRVYSFIIVNNEFILKKIELLTCQANRWVVITIFSSSIFLFSPLPDFNRQSDMSNSVETGSSLVVSVSAKKQIKSIFPGRGGVLPGADGFQSKPQSTPKYGKPNSIKNEQNKDNGK